MGLPRHWLLVSFAWYALLPCHILYSFTMWKDIPFALCTAVFLVTLYRLLAAIDARSAGRYALLFISGTGACLFRSNGWAVFLVSIIVFALLFRKKEKKLFLLLFLCIAGLTFVMKHQVLDAIGVSSADTVESLSIPVQQIARVITECEDKLTGEEWSMLNKLVYMRAVPVYYSEYISNPIKELVRETGDQEYLRDHALEYLKLYIRLGCRFPKQYFEAWVEQTKGYWNSGYNFWITAEGVGENNLGIFSSVRSGTAASLIAQYAYLFSSFEFLSLFQSIGFMVRLTAVLMFAAFAKGRKSAAFTAVPLLVNILSLLAAAPVFAEFRYSYGIFCLMPFLIFTAFKSRDLPAQP